MYESTIFKNLSFSPTSLSINFRVGDERVKQFNSEQR